MGQEVADQEDAQSRGEQGPEQLEGTGEGPGPKEGGGPPALTPAQCPSCGEGSVRGSEPPLTPAPGRWGSVLPSPLTGASPSPSPLHFAAGGAIALYIVETL